MENELIHVNLEQFLAPMKNNIDWSNVSEELKSFIAYEYNRGYYDAQRRLAKDLEGKIVLKLNYKNAEFLGLDE